MPELRQVFPRGFPGGHNLIPKNDLLIEKQNQTENLLIRGISHG
jgi:hypothetical protein